MSKKLSKFFSWIAKLFSPKLNYQNIMRYCIDFMKMVEVTKALSDLGYGFSSDGKLRKYGKCNMLIEKPFCYDISPDAEECRAHYVKLCSLITKYVYQMLVSIEKMRRLPVPEDPPIEDGTFIFVSKNYDMKDVLMILIQGSGSLRPGQWSLDLIINDSMVTGSQIPYIKMANKKGYGIMILNPNDNFRGQFQKIPCSGTAVEHTRYIWKQYVHKAGATKILIVAHSFGGIAVLALADNYRKDFEERVKAVAMIDSEHNYSEYKVTNYLKTVSKNWISSSAQLDCPMLTPHFDIPKVSAGDPRHEMTPAKSMKSVFEFFDGKVNSK